MPRHAPVLSLQITPLLRELRGSRTLQVMKEETGINVSALSRLERGEQLPRSDQIPALERGYGPATGWYSISMEKPD